MNLLEYTRMHPNNSHENKKTVVVGMSGGVDSSLTAALLKEQGYIVIGVYMRNWSEPIKGVEHCPWIQDQLDARRVADQLDIPFYTVNFEAEYKQHVVDSFLADYAAGRTPNPDVLCNQFIKFDHFWKYAQSLGADYVATGHYARVQDGQLLRGVDSKKDQSYFLWAINRDVLPHILMPLGDMQKTQVRQEAASRGLATATKKDSQGICFIGQADVRDFLRQQFTQHAGFKPGNVIDTTGAIIGKHNGAGYYTLGQKAGIADIEYGDLTNRPILYVTSISIKDNTITVGEDKDLYRDTLTASHVNWLVTDLPAVQTELAAKIRYGQQSVACVIVKVSSDNFSLTFASPQRAITPGQSVVLYEGDTMIGGGIIE